MKTWLTADWHLGEDRFALMGRPFGRIGDHIEAIMYEHNKVVRPEDTVIVNGDVCYQKAPQFLERVAEFNGRKILVRGNHDRVFTNEQLRPYFDQIYNDGDGFAIKLGGVPCYVTHYPTQGKDDLFNIVGHIHAAWKYQLNMLNVGVDVHHFRPVDADTIPFHLDAITKFYDQDVWVGYNPINATYQGKRGKAGSYFTPTK